MFMGSVLVLFHQVLNSIIFHVSQRKWVLKYCSCIAVAHVSIIVRTVYVLYKCSTYSFEVPVMVGFLKKFQGSVKITFL